MLEDLDLDDIEPLEILPTWRDTRGADGMSKRLDRFLLSNFLFLKMIALLGHAWAWIAFLITGQNCISLIGGRKPTSPFKFNPHWLNFDETTNQPYDENREEGAM
jgi:hypothetical protein